MTEKTGLPTGTVTFLFSVVEDAALLLEELGHAGYSALLDAQNGALGGAFAAHGGSAVDERADALFFAFPSAGRAVAAAVEAQRALGKGSRAGIGVHTGEASLGENGYVGFAVHQASRIADLARGGQILLSQTTATLVEHELAPDASLRSLGPARLAGFDRPETIFTVVAEGLQDGARPARVEPSAAGAPPLLERESELATVRAHVAATAAGDAGRLVAIEGRPGIGKTRLLAETRAAAAREGLTVLSARGGELEHDFAFGIVRQLFEPLLAAASPSERADLLAGPAARAGRLFEAGELAAADDDPGSVPVAMLHSLYWLAANLALRRPALLAIDDLHWADVPSLRWLAHLQPRLDGLPLLVVVATRPPSASADPQLVLSIVGDPAGSLLRPSALGRESAGVLARTIFGVEADPAFVDACQAASGGNPLFLEALLETLHAGGVEPVDANARRVAEVGPRPVTRAVMLRLSRVSPEAAGLARAVAVLGGHAELRNAAALAGQELGGAAEAAEALVHADLLADRLPLEFTHPVVRAAVYDELPAAERLAWHRRAAGVLAEARVEPEQVAAHLVQAQPSADAFVVETLRHAADRALARGASEVAVGFLRRALDEPPPPGARTGILEALGLAERLVDNDAAIVHLSEALEASHGSPRLALELSRALQRANRNPEAIEVLRRGRTLVADDPESERSMTAELIGAAWWDPEDLDLAEDELAAARRLELGDDHSAQLLRAILAYGEARAGDDHGYALRLAEEARDSGQLVASGSRALYSLGYVFTVAGRTDETLALFDEASSGALRRGDYVLASTCHLFAALARLFDGDLVAAAEDVVRVTELADLQAAAPYHAGFAAWMELERGDLDAAQSLLDASGLPEDVPPNGQFMYFHLVRGRLRLEQGRLDAAVRDLLALGEHSKALGHRNPAFMPWQPFAALALHETGRSDEAGELVEAALVRARIWGAPHMIGTLLRVQGVLTGGAEGVRILEEAVEVLGSSRAQLELARALVALGAALGSAAGAGARKTDARELLRRGLELAHRAGATGLEERARAELVSAGGRPRRVSLTGVEALTPSERRVAELAAGAMTNKAIAQELFVTPKTVEVHLSSVYRKLEIASRSELAAALA